MTPINTFIADVQQLFVEGFERILEEIDYPEVNVVGKAYTAGDLLQGLYELQPELLFMDLNFSDQDGMELIQKIRDEFADLKICILSGYTDHKFVKEAFQNGADGYYSKTNGDSELIECVNDLMMGNTFLASGLNITPKKNGVRKVEENNFEDRFLLKKKLTKREQEVLELITKALNNKEIGERLYISDQTVGVHRKNIMRKLNVRNTVNLIKFAIDHQLV